MGRRLPLLNGAYRWDGAAWEQISNVSSATGGYTATDTGTATILAANTTVTVAHTLTVVPDVVLITETNGTGVSTETVVSAKTATDFTLEVDIAPTTEDATYEWIAIKV